MNSGVGRGRTVLITGGSRGIGRGIVIGAIQQEYTVLFTYKTQKEQADETIALARKERSDARIHSYQLDVRDSHAVDAFVGRITDEHNDIYALVNNAAIVKDNATVLMTDEEWDDVIATNLSGPFYLMRGLVMHFLSNRCGRIVNMLSLSAYGSSGQANYSASKAGLEGLTHVLAREYGSKGITTNAVVAGMVKTDMVSSHLDRGLAELWHKFSPLRRDHTASEIADAVLFLISDSARSINGEVLKVTGGLNYVP